MPADFPQVSIVVPSYNQGSFIEDTLLSVLHQDYDNIEIIVMDGGSDDETCDILARYRAQIQYESKPDKGQSDAINQGFERARGEIVTWLNSDDVYPDRRTISRVVAAFRRYPDADLIYGDFLEIDAHNTVLRILRRSRFSLNRLLRIGYISQPATFFRRRVTERMKVREDLYVAMDTEYWLRAHSGGFRLRHLPFVLAAERLHGDAKCVKSAGRMADEARTVRQEYGATFSRWHAVCRFFDRVALYLRRLTGIPVLLEYRSHPELLTRAFHFDRAIAGTIGTRPKP